MVLTMKPFRAWAIFLAVLAVPTVLAVVLARNGALNEMEGRRRRVNEEHIETAARIRERLELTQRRGEDVLRQLPSHASAKDAEEALAAADLRFARVFVRRPGEPTPGNPFTQRTIKRDGHDVFSMASTSATDLLIGTRLEDEVEVGILVTEETTMAGAASMLNEEERLERRRPMSTPAKSGGKVMPWGTPFRFLSAERIDASDRSVVVSPQLILDVTSRDAARTEHMIRRSGYDSAKRWAIAYGAMVVLAIVLFARAQRAQRLAELRTDFVAAVSHELRTPLASVRMFAELLEAQAVPPEERVEVEQALAVEARRLHGTLERMLRFGALARGKLVARKAPASMEALAREATAKAKLPVRVDVDPDLVANVDAGLLGLAIENLVGNAVKYAPGDIRVAIRAEGESVVVDVVDHGPGLDARAQKKIFLPFERADDRLSRATEGTGVGLALVRGIARAHGGDVSVASAPGAGATFTLRFPKS